MTIDGWVYHIDDPPLVYIGNVTEGHSPLLVGHKPTKLGTGEAKKGRATNKSGLSRS